MAVPVQVVFGGSGSHRSRRAADVATRDKTPGEAVGAALSPWVLAVCSDSSRSGLTQPRRSLLEGLLAGGMLQLPEMAASPRGSDAGSRLRLRMKDCMKDLGR